MSDIDKDTVPVEADNTVQSPPVDVADNGDLENKVKDQSQKLHASKQEALRWKSEAETLKSEMEKLQAQVSLIKQHKDTQYTFDPAEIQRQSEEMLKNELYKRDTESAKQRFLNEFPEYNVPGDEDSDARWQELVSEVGMYKEPTDDGTKWYDLLKKAHKNLTKGNEIENAQSYGMAKALIDEGSTRGSTSSSRNSYKKISNSEKEQVTAGFAALRPDYFNS